MFLGDASSVLVDATRRALRQLERETRESSASEKNEGIIVSVLGWSDMSVLVSLFHLRLCFLSFFTSFFPPQNHPLFTFCAFVLSPFFIFLLSQSLSS